MAVWNNDKLAFELMSLQEQGFDLEVTGFSADDFLRLINAGKNWPPIDIGANTRASE
jgi:hypothetical protein